MKILIVLGQVSGVLLVERRVISFNVVTDPGYQPLPRPPQWFSGMT